MKAKMGKRDHQRDATAMRRRTAKPKSEKLNPPNEQEGDENQQEDKAKFGKGFFACYLLTSLCPRFKGHTYIGFTVNPRRRIRQHNGEIRCGAFRTKKRRPWEMVFCIYGFPTNVSALQFEWAWQHPMESVAVRESAATLKSFSGVANKIKLAYTMLNLPAWQNLNITVNYFSTKYANLTASGPSLPHHMKINVCPIDELPCYSDSSESSSLGNKDTEDSVDYEEIYRDTTNMSDTQFVNITEFQGYSTNEFPIYNRGGDRMLSDHEETSSSAVERVNETFTDTVFNISLNNEFDLPPTPEKEDHTRMLANELKWMDGEKYAGKDDKEDIQTTESFSVSDEIEVIDLLSPSPDCRIMSSRKKRRRLSSRFFPEIIDLT